MPFFLSWRRKRSAKGSVPVKDDQGEANAKTLPEPSTGTKFSQKNLLAKLNKALTREVQPLAAALIEAPATAAENRLAGTPASQPTCSPPFCPRDLWREAMDMLPTPIRQELRKEDSEEKSSDEQVAELVTTVKSKPAECEAKSWKFRVGDHEIVLRDVAASIVNSLTQIGDIAVQFAPPQASIPWSVVKAVMQIPVIESAQMCLLLTSTEKIVRIINRGQVYELVYTPENTPKPALENLQDVLVNLYSACLKLLANSSKLFSKSTAAQTVYAILHPGKADSLFLDLAELELKLSYEVEACEGGRSAAADDYLTRLLRNLDAPLARVDTRVCTLLEHLDEEKQRELLDWISKIPFGKHHDEVTESRTLGTCEWLLQHDRFREWEQTSSSVILWLQGSAGSGKTFLTSMVVDHVRGLLSRTPNHEGFAFFYCNRNEDLLSESKRPLKVFISSRPAPDIRMRFASQPNIEIQATDNQNDIEKFVNEEIDKPRLWGPISSSLRSNIVKVLHERSQGMFQWANLQIKQLLELPTEEDIQSRLGKLPIGLTAAYDEIYDKVAKHEHAKARVDRACIWVMSAFEPLTSEVLLQAIRVDSHSDNIDLADCITESSLQALCNNLLVLDSQRNVWRFAHLSVREYFEENHCNRQQAHCRVAKVCLKILLKVYENSDIRQYNSLGYKDDPQSQEIFDKERFRDYVDLHGIYHVKAYEDLLTKEAGADSMLSRLLKAFLQSPSESSVQYQQWFRQFSYLTSHWRYSAYQPKIDIHDIEDPNLSIYGMCRFSFYFLVWDWWNCAEIDIWQTNKRGDNLLVLTALAGCKPICEHLIQKRKLPVDALSNRGRYGSALAAAASIGNTETIDFLIQNNANVNLHIQAGDFGSALTAAATQGRVEIVELFVEKGANVNMVLQTGLYSSGTLL
ncbi:uncharacterized protein PAC_09792 [Phialocephala subalpina]|uniref:Uncharacterized protein n=1 Tax=Phialocephala subalpina TaxID=576137 RepID=A0A1L7X4E5_9HELO|nr:uncharacterized protein PAC_09792 [Phialocephala subalpina]